MTLQAITLGEAAFGDQSAILLDNLTLCMASRLMVLAPQRCSSILYPREGIDTSVFAEFCGLSTLVDALLLFDRVFVQSDYVDRWFEALPELHPIITLVDITPPDREAISTAVRGHASLCAHSEYFREYLRKLQMLDLEGAMLRTAHHYHGSDFTWVQMSSAHLDTPV